MKIKIKSYYGDLPEYLTEGKVYEFQKLKDYYGLVVVDNGDDYFTYLKGSAHLGGGSWEIVDDECD